MTARARARKHLLAKGARELSATEIPERISTAGSPVFRLPVRHQHGQAILLVLAASYPHSPPLVYLPELPGRLVPHVSPTGLVCLYRGNVFVNSDAIEEVIDACVSRAIDTLNVAAETSQKDLLNEISAYWPVDNPLVRIHFLPGHFSKASVAPLRRQKQGRFSIWSTDSFDGSQDWEGLAVMVDISEEEALEALAGPMAFIRKCAGRVTGRTILKHLTPRSKESTDIRFALLFRVAGAAPLLLGAFFRRCLCFPAKYSRNNEVNADRAVANLFKESPVSPVVCENVGQERLLRRASGTSGDPRWNQIKGLRVALLGCGALGGYIIDLLVRAGVRQLLLVDKDLLLPENRARHIANPAAEYLLKPQALALTLKSRFGDIDCTTLASDVLTDKALENLEKWVPDVVVSALAEPNANFRLSERALLGNGVPTIFIWVEPLLRAGHVVYQPAHVTPAFGHFYDDSRPSRIFGYRHRVVDNPEEFAESERGCQPTFTPFSPVELALFVAQATKVILSLLVEGRAKTTCYRGLEEEGYRMEEVQ